MTLLLAFSHYYNCWATSVGRQSFPVNGICYIFRFHLTQKWSSENLILKFRGREVRGTLERENR